MMIKIDNWSVTKRGGPYTAPECWFTCLAGHVKDHPRLGNGSVLTSEIVGVNGRTIETKSGSIYRLGKIDPKYHKWIKTNYEGWDWRNPIKMSF